ncbi:MAG: hypothetical protein Kow00117_19030 [Phototrophicales bacterium]
MEASLIYTCNIGGDLNLLPRLHTFIRAQRTDAILLDLGGACSPNIWHCEVTEGRSTLLVLDAMGYDLAYVELSSESREKLRNQVMMRLVDHTHPITYKDILFTTKPRHHRDEVLVIPAEKTYLKDKTLHLATIKSGEVGIVHVEGDMIQHHVHTVPEHIPPDPSISGTIEFVLSEARYFQRKKSRENRLS